VGLPERLLLPEHNGTPALPDSDVGRSVNHLGPSRNGGFVNSPPRQRCHVAPRTLTMAAFRPLVAVTVAVALVAPLRAALAVPGAAQSFALQLHQAFTAYDAC
jgi:hypothetical protein